MADGLGCHGERVPDLEALPAAFRRALDAPGPAVLDLPVDFTSHPLDAFWLEVVLKGMRFK